MGDFRFRVHHVRFFDFTPSAIHCLAYERESCRLALSRANGSIEIWSVNDNWYQEKTVQCGAGQSVEDLCWCRNRLFSGGLEGDVTEHDLLLLEKKSVVSSNNGAIWCLDKNADEDMMVAGTEDGCVVLFNITEEGLEYARSFVKQEGRILSIAWYNPDDLIVTGGIDNIRIWSVRTGQAMERLTLSRAGVNTETIVWCLAVTNDFTIISGDSQGKTCFWNGKQGTLYKEFQCHKADVLAVCVNSDGHSVFAAGIDPTLVQFEYISASPDSDWKMWIKSTVRTQHTHDVRALALTADMVVSGGIDCRLMVNQSSSTSHKGQSNKISRRISPIPQDCLVYTARSAGVIMLRYEDYLEVWQLGSTSGTSSDSGHILPLERKPTKLVQLKARLGEAIVCAAISDTAEWLAYSDTSTLRLFKLSMKGMDTVSPQVGLTKIKKVPAALLPAHQLAFSPDGEKLIISQATMLQVLLLEKDKPTLVFSSRMFAEKSDKSESKDGIHLLSIAPAGQMIAAANHRSQIKIYNTVKDKVVSSLPTCAVQPTAMAFHPTLPKLVVAYADQKVLEYDYVEQAYTVWSNTVESNWHKFWLQRSTKITQIMYNPHKPHQIYLRDEHLLTIIDQTQPMPQSKEKLYQKSSWLRDGGTKPVQHAFHICDKFRFLMHFDIWNDDFMVVVERPIQALMEKLPSSLKNKKFGT